MASYEKYTRKKDGKKFWSFQLYLGTDDLTGKPIRLSRRRSEGGELFKTKEHAENEVARIEEAYKKGVKTSKIKRKKKKDKRTFEEVAEEWLVNRYKDTVKDSTYLATKHMYFDLYILKKLGKYRIKKINKEILEPIIKNWSTSFTKPRYSLLVNYTKKVFKYAKEERYIEENPFEITHVPVVKEKKKKDGDFYDKAELNDFLEASKSYSKFGQFWNIFFHLLSFSGLRSGEARALTWDDINFDKGFVHVNKTLSVRMGESGKTEMYQSDMTKTGVDRIVTLDKDTIDKLKFLQEQQAEDVELVFPALRGELNQWMHGQTANNAMTRIAELNDLKRIKLHELRHTHCSLLFDAGVGVKEVQKRMGHKDITVTLNIYTHVTKGKQNEVADTLMQYVNNE